MPRTQLSRTPLSKQTGLLRSSLFLSLGLSPLACGGTAATGPNSDGGASAQAGASSSAGALVTAGAPPVATAGSPSYGGASSHGGALSYGGTASHGGAATAGAGQSGGASSVVACPNPVFNPITKLIDCSNGRKHRAEAMTCTFTVPPTGAAGAGGVAGAGGSDGAFAHCSTKADCAALPYGYCDQSGGNTVPVCRAGCTKDSDCGSEICACNGTEPGRCTSAGCATDADCGPNSLCAPVDGLCGPGSFECTTPEDKCSSPDDCGGGACTFEGTHRICNGAVCGRPFLIAELPRVAAIASRSDWLDGTLTPNPSGLTPVQRAQLAAHWARLGQMEHASIAAFARFQLQLLSLGAPSDLVEACNHALADETAHARTCFSFASAYGGSALGPARLNIEHCFEDTSLTAIAKLVLREGCLGETVASLEALAAAEVAREPAVKQALERIAQDELNHAELAFKFLRWALAHSSPEAHHELAREAAQRLADFESEARNAEHTRTDDRLAAHGLIAGDALHAIHLAAARDVARPLLAALFDLEAASDA